MEKPTRSPGRDAYERYCAVFALHGAIMPPRWIDLSEGDQQMWERNADGITAEALDKLGEGIDAIIEIRDRGRS